MRKDYLANLKGADNARAVFNHLISGEFENGLVMCSPTRTGSAR